MSVSFAYQRKVALIIGIDEYPYDPLHYCVNDATDLKTCLHRLNFDVTLGVNINLSEFSRVIDAFANTIQRNDLVLFYFAGHGKQEDDQNYLLPVDYHYDHGPHEREYIGHHAINIQHIMKKIDARKCRTTIYIFDCCRFLVKTGAINTKQGLIAMHVPVETFIVYSCIPGQVIHDETRNKRNGSFIQNFLKHIETPGKDIEEIMRNVARDVNIQTGGLQLPYRTSCLTDKVCFVTNTDQVVSYDITVVTGNEKGAGTDSQVYLTLFGHDGRRTEKIPLKNSATNKNPFERNQTDTFRVTAAYIGELVKLRIEHDNTGMLAAWFLDRIIVTSLSEPRTKYIASCNKWLAKNEGDGEISRELMLRKETAGVVGGRQNTQLNNQYKISVYTGKKAGAGTDAGVFINLFGKLGESGPIVLQDKKKNPFESGQKDEFIIECPNLGELHKILIAHDNKGRASGWFLDHILIEDARGNRIYEFPCNKWLATDEDDRQISRFLFPKATTQNGAHKEVRGGISYTINVYTSAKPNAGTDARVYIIMHKNKLSSNKIFLTNGKFEQKCLDIFTVDATDDFSPLTALDVGHDNSGMGPGWHLDKVVVNCPTTGIKQTFPCNAWLAKDEGDRLIERRLQENLSLRKTRQPTVPWYIWVYTSNMKGAGTDAQVNLVLYGQHGKSNDILLENKANTLEAGQCDEFKVDIIDVGTPFKLRVSHDNKKTFAPWHLDRIEMENFKTHERYVFPCRRWLSKSDDDKQVIRELPAQGRGIQHPLPLVKYIVDVHTGKKANAGTDANVFINIFGEHGDTGERPLEYSKNRNKFEKGQVDSFVVEAVSLNRIKKIRIGHDNTGMGPGWFLDKVVIRSEEARHEPATFLCDRWLDAKEDDGLIVRELTLGEATQHLDKTTYHVKIKTGDIAQAGTDADVHLQMFGEKGATDKIRLDASDNTKNKFERGVTDMFTLECDDLGKIGHIIIGHNGKNLGAGWFLDWVEIDVPMRGELYRFACNRWLDTKEGDRKIELDLVPSEVIKKASVIPYEITVFTGDKNGAGTDAPVFIQMYGLHGKTEEIFLKNKSDTFERKAKDTFKIEAPDIGQIQKIRIGHNSKKMGSAWYLEKVLVQRHLSEAFDRRLQSAKSLQHLSKISASDSSVEQYWFVCQQWLDAGEGDKQTVRELLPTDEHGTRLGNQHELTYLAHVFTGDKNGAGTDANVFLTIYGEKGDSGERELVKSKTNKNKFEQKQEDIFEVKGASLGKLRRIKIRHDNKGLGSAWYLDRIQIVDPETNHVYHFICQKWLAVDKEDGMISREIPVHDSKDLHSSNDYGLEMKALATTYKVSVVTSSKPGAGTNANVYIIIFGAHNDTGKVPLVVSKTHKDPFEKGNTDVFDIEAMDIGEPKKIKIGRDDAGFAADWLLDRVEIDVPKMGRTWLFPCDKWLSKTQGDCLLELELYPKAQATQAYTPHVPYEIRVFTSKISGAGTDANVFIEIFGAHGKTTGQVLLGSQIDQKAKFESGSIDTFVLELEDVGHHIEKIRIGHDNSGFGAAWHLDHVEIRRILKGQTTNTYVFKCGRWFAKNEDDKAIVRELIPDKLVEEKFDVRGQPQAKERAVDHRLAMKQYQIDVHTGDKFGAGTDANVYCTIYGDKGDSGERELANSETNKNKFERKQVDRFKIECADLGHIVKIKIRQDNAGLGSDWLLDKVEVKDGARTYMFHCEQWLGKGKGDSTLERILYAKVT